MVLIDKNKMHIAKFHESNHYHENDLEFEKRLNQNIIRGYVLIVVFMVVGYGIEILKNQKSIQYVALFTLSTIIPLVLCWWKYVRNPYSKNIRYWVITGYFITYVIAYFSAESPLVFTYILPILAFFVLYHQPRLILIAGFGTLVVNIAHIILQAMEGQITVENSSEVEIQLCVLFLCFAGSYFSSKMYNRVHAKNEGYLSELQSRTQQIQDMTLQTIETIANTIDAKDMYTKGHSRRVSIYAKHIAMELGLSENQINDIIYMGLLHDIGKISVPDSILNKPGKLTDSEYERMKEHTIKGGEIFKDITMVPGLSNGAMYHHERYDGKGYPSGLKGEEIPLEARIICLADSFDAMTSTRVYRKKLSMDVVISEIKRCRGTQFDPTITDAFLRYLEKENYMEEIDNLGNDGDKTASIQVLKQYMKGQAKHYAENAEKDELTRVYNRSAGERYIATAVKNQLGYVMLINLDNMRNINNKYGFRRGDYYLQQISHILSEMDLDIKIARFGGDEFLCFVPNVIDRDTIAKTMDQLMDDVHNLDKTDPFIIDMTLSIGIAIHDRADQSLSNLLLLADKALYHVKQTSKNGYYFYVENDHIKESFSRAELARLIEQLKKKDSFADSSLLEKEDLQRISHFINDVEEEKMDNVSLIMFTAKPEKNDIMVENRNAAMQFVDQAIKSVMRDDNSMVRYSSLQRIVIATGTEDRVEEIAKEILDAFNESYTKQDHHLSVMSEKIK